ncbi:MAG TPA: hypothetical protein VNQ34_09575 [Xanthobacteraceae bacterium]|jgi:hypothetical protein|nr:hypothetical protein [Xanthobacteraceae bacterium]
MLFDLRVVLAACLATFIFVAAGIGLISGSRSPFKAAADGPRIAGPGLPQSMPLPLPDSTRGEEITGTIADHGAASVALKPQEMTPDRLRDGEKAPEKAQEMARESPQEKAEAKTQLQEKTRETRAAPKGKGRKQTITSLIEQDAAAHSKAAAKPKPRRRRVHPKQAKQPPPSNNPFAAFMNNNANSLNRTAPSTAVR